MFLDVLVCAQHRGIRPDGTCPNAVDCRKFEDVVSKCIRTVFYASPLLNPLALSRAWCLYEIMKTIRYGKELLVVLSESDREDLKGLISNNFDRIETMFSSIKSANAQATHQEDEDMIFEMIRRDLGANGVDGFKMLDDAVSGRMRAWMAQSGAKFAKESEDADLYTSVGQLLKNLARFDEAELLYRSALVIKEAAHGPEHSNVASMLNNLAGLLVDQGKYDEAEPLYRRALVIREIVYGPDHADVAKTLDDLANLLRVQGKYDDAEPLFRRALMIREAIHEPDHPDVVTTLNNLANLLYAQGKYNEAEPLYSRALANREAVHGPDHPKVAVALNNLAHFFAEQGK